MSSGLSFLGLDNIGYDGKHVSAPLDFPGTWRSQHLEISGNQLSGVLLITLDGYKLRFTFEGIYFDTTAGVPLSVDHQYTALVRVAMGSHSEFHEQTYMVGPAIFEADNGTLGIFENQFGRSGGYPLQLRALRRSVITGGPPADSALPLELFFTPDSFLEIDLGNACLRIPQGGLGAELRSLGGPAARSPGAPMYANPQDIVLPFSSLANLHNKRTPKPWPIAFDKQQGSPFAPLNVSGDGKSVVGLTAVDGGLQLTLGRSPGATPVGAQVRSAAVGPSSRGKLTLRFNGLRDALNQPELWATDQVVPLAFRSVEQGAPSTPLAYHNSLPVVVSGFKRVGPNANLTRQPPLHSWIPAARFELTGASNAELHIGDGDTLAAPPVDWCVTDIQRRASRPWIQFFDTAFAHSRPGNAYTESGETFWTFTTPATPPGGAVGASARSGGAPVVPLAVWTDPAPPSGTPDPLVAADEAVNAAFEALVADASSSTNPPVHETGFWDTTSVTTGIARVMPLARGGEAAVQLKPQVRTVELERPIAARGSQTRFAISFGVESTGPLSGVALAEYALCWPNENLWHGDPPPLFDVTTDWTSAISGPIDSRIPINVGTVASPTGPISQPVAILKLGRRQSLPVILGEIRGALAPPLQGAFATWSDSICQAIRGLDSRVLEASWVGLLVFGAPLDLSGFPALQSMFSGNGTGQDAPTFAFLAVAAGRAGRVPLEDVAISASVAWPPDGPQPPKPPNFAFDDQEASIQPIALSVGFVDRRLVQFSSTSLLQFRSFLGMRSAGGNTTKIPIIGSVTNLAQISATSLDIQFCAAIPDGQTLQLYPIGGSTPANQSANFIKTVRLRRVAVIAGSDDQTSGATAEVQIDGVFDLQQPAFTGAQPPNALATSYTPAFANLRIALAPAQDAAPRPLTLQYPSVQFDMNSPHVALLGDALKLKFHMLGVDWPKNAGQTPLPASFPLEGFGGIGGLPASSFSGPSFAVLGRLDFGSLPDLFARNLPGLTLETAFAMPLDGAFSLTGAQYYGVRALGFDALNFDFLSFLSLRVSSLTLANGPWTPPGALLSFEGASVSILGVEVLNAAEGAFFSKGEAGGDGFWALAEGPQLGDLFKIDWLFAARNVDFTPGVALDLLTPPPDHAAPTTADYSGLAAQLQTAWASGDIFPATQNGARGWTFAASLSALYEGVSGRALIQDGGFTGLALWGAALTDLLGYNFCFVGLYRKNITPGQDYFYFSVTLPNLSLGDVRFTGGQIAAEIYTSGDFQLDFGFPWPSPSGGRLWNRTIGAIVTPGQASGGFYLGRAMLAGSGKGVQVFQAGYAIQWGLGASFSAGGMLTAWVRIGVYLIADGQVTLALSNGACNVAALTVTGAAGVLVEGYAELDWWVVSIRIGVQASAEVGVTIHWVSDDGPATMFVYADFSVSASAQACIGGSCYRVCQGISVTLDIPVNTTVTLG
jgi:hypothetical protein